MEATLHAEDTPDLQTVTEDSLTPSLQARDGSPSQTDTKNSDSVPHAHTISTSYPAPNEASNEEKGGYFDAEALAVQLKARQSLASYTEREETAPSSAAATPGDSTLEAESKLETLRASESDAPVSKKTPGWKGWLRSASNSNNTSFRLDLGRKSPINPQPNSTCTTIPSPQHLDDEAMTQLFDKLRASESMNGPPVDWSFYREVIRHESPREIPDMHSKIRAGIPSDLRSIIWQTLANSKDLELESIFRDLTQDSTYKYEKQIKKDVARMSKNWDRQMRKEL